MFDFEKLEVYKKSKTYNNKALSFIKDSKLDRIIERQLQRASFSIMLNIAEGSGRFTNPDRRNFYIIARGSVFECVAIYDYLKDNNEIANSFFESRYAELEEISKMLFSLIKGLSKQI